MNPYYRLKALTHYPEWHDKPLRLSIAEIKDPWLVLEEFFNMYDLPNVRDILELWLNDTIDAGSEDLSKHMHTCNMFEKLAEAAFLLHQQKEQEGNEETAGAGETSVAGSESGNENDTEEDDPDMVEEEAGRKPFSKRPFWKEGAGGDPVKAFSWVFNTEDLDTLKETIEEWCIIALTNERANYEEAVQRAGLLAFCDELAKLADAAYCIHRIHAIEKRSGFPLSNPVNLQPEILRKEKLLSLSYEELLHPEEVLDHFCRRFTPAYIRAELWDLLDSVISTDSNEIEKDCLLLHYQCLLTLTQAAWHLHSQESPAEIEKHSNQATVETTARGNPAERSEDEGKSR
jgi:hypothetical protein